MEIIITSLVSFINHFTDHDSIFWDLTRVIVEGYGASGELSNNGIVDIGSLKFEHSGSIIRFGWAADFTVDIRQAAVDKSHLEMLLERERREDAALIVKVIINYTAGDTNRSQAILTKVVPNHPSDGFYFVRYETKTLKDGKITIQIILT